MEQVGVEAKSLGGTKILLVSDQTLHKAGYVERAVLHLERGGSQVETYTDVSPEPTLNEAIRIAEFARSRDYNLVVGLGGGSPMDMAKLASVARTNSGAVKDYVGVNKLVNRGAPKILIPTTAGTGSEVTPNTIVSLSEDEIKSGIVSPYLFADVALVDPQLTLTVPPKVTASTGFDALAHAIEANISKGANPVTDALSLKAIHLISKSLVAVYVDGSDLEARSDLALASTLAGMAIAGAGTCAGHAVAYAFAVKCKCPHGISTGLALPYIMEYNLPLRVEKLINIALALGEKVENSSSKKAAFRSVIAVKELLAELGMPTRLKDLNVPKELLPTLVDDALKSVRLTQNNPRRMTREETLRLFERMWEGETWLQRPNY